MHRRVTRRCRRSIRRGDNSSISNSSSTNRFGRRGLVDVDKRAEEELYSNSLSQRFIGISTSIIEVALLFLSFLPSSSPAVLLVFFSGASTEKLSGFINSCLPSRDFNLLNDDLQVLIIDHIVRDGSFSLVKGHTVGQALPQADGLLSQETAFQMLLHIDLKR